MRLTAVILAAGYSSRMEGFKPLMELGGRSLLALCADLFRGAAAEPVVVSGHRGEEVEAEAARLGLATVRNPHFDRGMYSSVRAALSLLARIDGFFLMPVDIPLVRPSTVRALAAAFDGESVLFPSFDGQRGHPPLIPARLVADILAYDGAGGLKVLLEQQPNRDVPVWDRGILLDADTPEDFARLAQRFERLSIGEPEEALALARLAMPEKGVAHGLAVSLVAEALGRELNRHGYLLDLDLLRNAALLHDIAKGQLQHEARGAELLTELGLEGLSESVAAHRDAVPPASGLLTEKEVVCLADKLVRGRFRVSVRRRFTEKLEQYSEDSEACRAIRDRLAKALTLESLMQKAAGRSVAEILDDVELG